MQDMPWSCCWGTSGFCAEGRPRGHLSGVTQLSTDLLTPTRCTELCQRGADRCPALSSPSSVQMCTEAGFCNEKCASSCSRGIFPR